MSISTASAWRAGEQAPAGHQDRARRARPRATAPTRIQSIWWSCVASALSITAPVSAMSAIARALREDGEHDRDDQRELVGAQEARVAGRTCGDSEGPSSPSKSSDPPGCDGFARARGGSRRTAARVRSRFAATFEPAARAGRVRERDGDGAVVRSNAVPTQLGEVRDAEQPIDGEPADRDDQLRPDQPQLPVPPEGAELLFARRRRPVAASDASLPG